MKRDSHPGGQDDPQLGSILPWSIRRLTAHSDQVIEAGVVMEEPLEIRLNGQPVAVLMRTPGLEKELAVGFCLGEGWVAGAQDIALVRHCGRIGPDDAAADDSLEESRNRIDIQLLPGRQSSVAQDCIVRLIRSGCGRADASDLAEGLVPVTAGIRVSVSTLSHLPAQITRRQAAYRSVRGIHAAALFDGTGQAVVVCEDIGRHNSVDKATGFCLLRGIPLHDKILVSTGRASYDMVVKGVRLGIPILASFSSPTSLAVELAQALNCTLLGYLRGKALNVYTHGWRVIPEE